jgi:hypothetical protein
MSQQALAYLNRMGIQPAVDVRGMDLSRYQLNTLEDLDQLAAAATAEADRLGYPGQLYRAWESALARGLDQTLPSLEAAPGISRSIEDLAGDAAMAQQDSARYFVRESMHPSIANASLYGRAFTDWDVNELRDQLSAMLVDLPPSQRGPVMAAINGIDNSTSSSVHSVSWSAPEESNTVHISTTEYDSPDAYTNWRNGQGNVDGNSGLDSLFIRPSVNNDAIWSGITDWNGSGGTYEVSSDWHLNQHVAQQQSDFHQGDATNTFSE